MDDTVGSAMVSLRAHAYDCVYSAICRVVKMRFVATPEASDRARLDYKSFDIQVLWCLTVLF